MVLAASTLALVYRAPRKELGFAVPSAAEAREAQRRFAALLADPVREPGADTLPPGLVAARLAEPQALALSEPDGACRGRGTYLLRSGSGSFPIAVMAPHRGADRDTGPLARLLFEEQPFAAAAWNSAPRTGGEGDCPHAGDIARLPTHFLTSFSLAFAALHPSGRIVQLHGFDQLLRKGQAGQEADAIVSDGSRQPSMRLLDLTDCLSRTFADRQILSFPGDTVELGATTNAQGQALRSAGFAGFTHLELSAGFRHDLVADRALRQRFAACLGAGL
jgi:hypothetical protein